MNDIKLNLGCGFDKRPGYVNIDAHPNLHPDLVLDLSVPNALMTQFECQSVTEVLAHSVLEHLFHWEAVNLLEDIHLVLKPGGRLVVTLPDVAHIMQTPSMTLPQKIAYLYGGQDIPLTGESQAKTKLRVEHPEWFTHRYGYTPATFSKTLSDAGFRQIICSCGQNNFTATAIKP